MFTYILDKLKKGSERGLNRVGTYFDYGYTNEKTDDNIINGVRSAAISYGRNKLFLINKKLDTIVFCKGRDSNLVTSYIYVWKKGKLKCYNSPFVKSHYNENIKFDTDIINGSTWGKLVKSYFDLTKFDFNYLLNDKDTFCIVNDFYYYKSNDNK